jgi:squalene-hopene/tetraprenyl-beta-curcumene cyclase
VPDVGPTCEVLLADRLFHDLEGDERDALLAFVRKSQDAEGAWLDAQGRPDLSLTVLGWWVRAQAGDDPDDESMIRARRVVHALGGAQRASFSVRLWLALGGHIPWTFLPAIPSEMFLLPPASPMSPARYSPWARGVLTPYLVLARAGARLQLGSPGSRGEATELLLRRNGESLVAPRLTRPGLAGDLLQAFDRTVKLARKLPRGPLPELAVRRALAWIEANQQEHGGWFSLRPTLLSLVALRVMGARSDDDRVRRGLDWLRRARGLARIRHGVGAGQVALAQGLSGTPLSTLARLMRCDPQDHDVAWLVRQELREGGPWQALADAPAGGWPLEVGSRRQLDVAATVAVLDALGALPASSSQTGAAWATTRRATDVLLAMQEPDGGFSRFERGESRVFMRRFPWTDADLLAFGAPDDTDHVRLTAETLAQLAHTGFRTDDDRIARSIAWLERALADEHRHADMPTLAAAARATGALLPAEHALRVEIERRVRARQREDGSFGDLVDTALGVAALADLGHACVQAVRGARHLVAAIERLGDGLAEVGSLRADGFGLSSHTYDPSAAAREAVLALRGFAARGGKLAEASA